MWIEVERKMVGKASSNDTGDFIWKYHLQYSSQFLDRYSLYFPLSPSLKESLLTSLGLKLVLRKYRCIRTQTITQFNMARGLKSC